MVEQNWHGSGLRKTGALLCRPADTTVAAALQATSAYESLAQALVDKSAKWCAVAGERLFVRDREAAGTILEARRLVLAASGLAGTLPTPVVIEQPPVAGSAALELLVCYDRQPAGAPWAPVDLHTGGDCGCAACAQSGARVLAVGTDRHLVSSSLYGRGDRPLDQARDMFRVAQKLLADAGMDFRQVVRTWIYLRDIDRDYDALNQARREFFSGQELEIRPASTAVQGATIQPDHVCALSLEALAPRPESVTRMSSPKLNEAWTYGADFSRGLRVSSGQAAALYLSGTASIDAAGSSRYAGDLEAQAGRMVDNLESLLAEQGAAFGDVLYGITYVKRAEDGEKLLRILLRRGFGGFPMAFVVAPLCRPELLCESELLAHSSA